MGLVQEDDSHNEHVIYYLSQSLMTTKTKYLHVEKMALATVQVVHIFITTSYYIEPHLFSIATPCYISLLDNCWGSSTPNG
jgi:hypothetical protein